MKQLLFIAVAVSVIVGCREMQPLSLYDNEPKIAAQAFSDFNADVIYADASGNEVWSTQAIACLSVVPQSKVSYKGTSSLHIKWNKPGGGCDWIGMGIGWDNWTGKDISSVLSNSALQFFVKSNTAKMRGLPWAVGFEDFNGDQAWTGVFATTIKGGVVDTTWTEVLIPLSEFPFLSRGVDATNIKQVIFQFESEGSVDMDEIKLVPYTPRGRMALNWVDGPAPRLDGQLSAGEWVNTFSLKSSNVYLQFDQQNLYVAGRVKDATPLINANHAGAISNGDAVELAFSSSRFDDNRPLLLEGDRHIVLKLSDENEGYDWTQKSALTCDCKTRLENDSTFTFECSVPWTTLKTNPWSAEGTYNIEVAVDHGDEKSRRKFVERWNTPNKEGFGYNPSMWGIMNYHTQPK